MKTVEIPRSLIQDACKLMTSRAQEVRDYQKSLKAIANEVGVPLEDLRKVIRKVRRTPENGGYEIMEQTGIDEAGWTDIDSRVRKEIRRIDKVEKQMGLQKNDSDRTGKKIRSGMALVGTRQEGDGRMQPPFGCVDSKEITRSWNGLLRFDSRRQHWFDQSS